MKRFEIDTNNNWLGPDKPTIPRRVLQEFVLVPGETVMVTMEPEAWLATVRYDPTLPDDCIWYAELGSKLRSDAHLND